MSSKYSKAGSKPKGRKLQAKKASQAVMAGHEITATGTAMPSGDDEQDGAWEPGDDPLNSSLVDTPATKKPRTSASPIIASHKSEGLMLVDVATFQSNLKMAMMSRGGIMFPGLKKPSGEHAESDIVSAMKVLKFIYLPYAILQGSHPELADKEFPSTQAKLELAKNVQPKDMKKPTRCFLFVMRCYKSVLSDIAQTTGLFVRLGIEKKDTRIKKVHPHHSHHPRHHKLVIIAAITITIIITTSSHHHPFAGMQLFRSTSPSLS